MWRTVVFLGTATLSLVGVGCVSGPMQENPVLVRPANKPVVQGNPLWIPGNHVPLSYGMVFEKVIDVVDDYFEISYTNRYDGRIETFPRVSPGLGQPWKPGSPNLYERLLSTLQSMRNRAIVKISPAEDGGYLIDVKVYRELEDLAQPLKANTTSAVFRNDLGVERQFAVIDESTFESLWIPKGRDVDLEQLILCRLARAKYDCVQPSVPQPVP